MNLGFLPRSWKFIIPLVLLSGCNTSSPPDERFVASTCREYGSLCDATCLERRFKVCYVDTDLFGNNGPYDVQKMCHAMHYGNTCPPCEQHFTLNFGGAMRNVSCQEFHKALARKNKQCSNCLKKVGEGPN